MSVVKCKFMTTLNKASELTSRHHRSSMHLIYEIGASSKSELRRTRSLPESPEALRTISIATTTNSCSDEPFID